VRPLVIALLLGAAGASFSAAEEEFPVLSTWVPHLLFPSRADPQVAQVILGGIATSIMTVVSIVFAILLMTLTLASVQFSPRILVSFVRDRTTQWTLGLFLGTFTYCMAALPAARALPTPFSPVATVSGAMLLALLCVGWLIYFIHHISQAISVNYIVDRIAGETEQVLNELMPFPRGLPSLITPSPPRFEAQRVAIPAPASGYLRVIDMRQLLTVAKTARVQVQVLRRVGHFVPAGVPLMLAGRTDRLTERTRQALQAAFDIGPTRTLQQDVEFGVLQIVDIALKAISPAVNDPSTAITCLDQLSRILILWVARREPDATLYDPPHVLRVAIPWISLHGLLDTAFEQIRSYAEGDLPVSLRLVRVLQDIATTTEDRRIRAELLVRGERVLAGCGRRFGPDELARLQHRVAVLRQLVDWVEEARM
jgi:uncharacterized membrane protein